MLYCVVYIVMLYCVLYICVDFCRTATICRKNRTQKLHLLQFSNKEFGQLTKSLAFGIEPLNTLRAYIHSYEHILYHM